MKIALMSCAFLFIISCSHFRGGCHKHHGEHNMGDHKTCPYKQDKPEKKDEASSIINNDRKVTSCIRCEQGQV